MDKIYIEGPNGQLEEIEKLDEIIKEQKEKRKNADKRNDGTIHSNEGETEGVASSDVQSGGADPVV